MFINKDDAVRAVIHALEAESVHYGVTLTAGALEKLGTYYEILSEWNPRLHLVAPCVPEEFASRHILESLCLLDHLPAGSVIADVGSGAGLPIVPCLIARPDLRATLIESSKRKAVFLREVLKRISRKEMAAVLPERFERVTAPQAGFVTCRALDQFGDNLPELIEWAPRASKLLLFGGESLSDRLVKIGVHFRKAHLPKSERRFLFVVEGRG